MKLNNYIVSFIVNSYTLTFAVPPCSNEMSCGWFNDHAPLLRQSTSRQSISKFIFLCPSIFWNVFYPLNQSSIVFFLDFLMLALGKPLRMIFVREKRARKGIPVPWPWARRLNVSGNRAQELVHRAE